jgi:hypothetical protein
MGQGWQSVASPGSSRQWIRTERTPDGWTLVVSMESPSRGSTVLAVYGPVPNPRQALALLDALRHALAVAPSGNVPLVLTTFGLPSLPRIVAPHVATAAQRRARTAASPEAPSCGVSSSPVPPAGPGVGTATCSSNTPAGSSSCPDAP